MSISDAAIRKYLTRVLPGQDLTTTTVKIIMAQLADNFTDGDVEKLLEKKSKAILKPIIIECVSAAQQAPDSDDEPIASGAGKRIHSTPKKPNVPKAAGKKVAKTVAKGAKPTKKALAEAKAAKKNDPNRPPSRPMTPFFKYVQDQRESILAANPTWTNKEKFGGVSKVAKERLAALDEATLAKMNKTYEDAKVQYKIDEAAYMEANPDATRGTKRAVAGPIGEDPRGKRPMNAYFKFTQDQRESIVAANPNWTNKEKFGGVSKIAKARWEALDETVRQRHEAEYKEAMRKYNELWGKKEKDPNMPKKPMSAYFQFMSDNKAQILKENPQWTTHSEKFGGVAKEAVKRFKEISTAEREALEKRFKDGYVIYYAKMEEYKKGLAPVDAEQAEQDKKVRSYKIAQKAKRLLKKRNLARKAFSAGQE